jgi:hypothetical protein
LVGVDEQHLLAQYPQGGGQIGARGGLGHAALMVQETDDFRHKQFFVVLNGFFIN